MHKVSIITINRNNAAGLRRTMESVFQQTYTDLEYLVVDGASTDESLSVINEYAQRQTAIDFKWISEKDAGIYNAMNKGFRHATGEYCLFLNSGDCLVDKNVLAQVTQVLIDDADVYYGDAIFVSAQQKEQYRTYPNKLNLDFFYNDSLCHQSIFYKRNMLLSVGEYDEHYRLIADWVMNLQCYRHGYQFKHLALVCVYYDMAGLTSGANGEKRCRQEREQYYRHNGLWYIHMWMWIKRKFNLLIRKNK